MLTVRENVFILLAMLFASWALMALLNRLWRLDRRQHKNDLIGWQLSVLGTTYAVLLGFMLYTVWTDFGAAELNVELEASALRNLYRLAEGLPTPQRNELIAGTRSYAAAVINYDWPAMANGRLPEKSHEINEAMWRTLMSAKDLSPSQSIAEDHAVSELSELTAHRRTRLLHSVAHLPFILWCVLLTGAALTLCSVNLFGSSSTRLHALQVFSLTLLITLTMLAIADINQPFRGWVCVNDLAFQRALQSMQGE